MDGVKVAEALLPDNPAAHIELGKPDPLLVRKRHEDVLAITRRSRGGLGIFLLALHKGALVKLGGPELMSSGAIEAEHGLRQGVFIRRRQKNAVAPDGGRTMATARDGRFPEDVAGGAPVGGRGLGLGRDVVAIRAAPPGPIMRAGFDIGGEWGSDREARE